MKLIDKDALLGKINKRITDAPINNIGHQRVWAYNDVKDIIDTLEVIDPYEQCIQYASIESGIKAHAEEYSFNIESDLFNQLTKEQQTLWRKEIEQACISGGYNGLDLAKDPRYEENSKVKGVDFEKEIKEQVDDCWVDEWSYDVSQWIRYRRGTTGMTVDDVKTIAKHFFELGLKAQIMTSKLQQRISVLKMEFWTGLQTFAETEMTLSDAYNQGIDDILEELGLKAQKGEEV